MTIVFALLLILILTACWLLTLLSMPGNWLMVAAAALYVLLVPAKWPAMIGWRTVAILLILAALGEVVELLAGARQAAKAGGSKRAAALAVLGSLFGGIAGICVGLPIPLVGSVFAAILFAALGAMLGAVAGETWSGRSLDESWQVAKAAFWGRLKGAAGKVLLGAAMIAVVAAAMLL